MEYLPLINWILWTIEMIALGFAMYYTNQSFKISDHIISQQEKYIAYLESVRKVLLNDLEDYKEAISRNRQMLQSYKEENSRCWRAVEVWEQNYRELEALYIKDTKKKPPEL